MSYIQNGGGSGAPALLTVNSSPISGGAANTVLADNGGTLIEWPAQGTITATGNLTFYVDPAGSDSNPGTIGSPFLTIQHALNVTAQYNYQGLYFPKINLNAGTYTEAIILPPLFNLAQTQRGYLVGDNTTPGNVVLDATGHFRAIYGMGGNCIWEVDGFQINGNCSQGISVTANAFILPGALNWNITGTIYYIQQGGTIFGSSAGTLNYLKIGNGWIFGFENATFDFQQEHHNFPVNGTSATLVSLQRNSYAVLDNMNLGSGNGLAISSGTYVSGTGVISLTMSATVPFTTTGFSVILMRLTGSGNLTGLDADGISHDWVLTASSGTSVTLAGPIGLGAITITGGTLSTAIGRAFSIEQNSYIVTTNGLVTDLPGDIAKTGQFDASCFVIGDSSLGGTPFVTRGGGASGETAGAINAQSGAGYTLAISDAGNLIEMTRGSANTVTVPTNATVPFPLNTRITIVQAGTGATTVAAAGGVTGHNFGTLAAQWANVHLYQRAIDEWVMVL